MTTTRSSLSRRLRPQLVGAAIALLVAAGCSSDDPGTTATTVAPTTTTTGAAAAPAPATTDSPVDAQTLLATAIAAYAEGYEFTATTTVNEQVASIQTGRWISGAALITVVSGDGEVEYIITPEGQWARLPGAEWEELDGASAQGHPLDGLTRPDSLQVAESSSGVVVVNAVYSAAALQLEGDPVAATLTFRDGLLGEIRYTADVEGNTLETVTTLQPVTDSTPIMPPG